jgi:hypothetical protein
MLPWRTHFVRWIGAIVCVCAAGCGSGDPKIVEVSGTLTYKGNPVPNVLVNFEPQNGRMSSGQTDEKGHFKLNYERGRDGALVGKHRVFVINKQTAAGPGREPGKTGPVSGDMAVFFDKYGEKSTVEVEIDKNTKEVNLKWD